MRIGQKKFGHNYFGTGADGDVTISTPTSLTSTLDGDFVVKNYNSLTVSGPVITEYTTTSNTNGLALGSDGNMWYATNTTKIGKVTPAGVVTEYGTTSTAQNLALGSDSNIWYSTGTTKVGKITPNLSKTSLIKS